MTVPVGAYAVKYSMWLYDESGGTVETNLDAQFPLSENDAAQAVEEDAAAEAAMGAWKASMTASYPGVPVHASRVYLCRASGDAWPSSS
ncbi:hypothetical protein ACFW2V_12405 [Streptomyces sp. NPDC058947]|uniref:hypothetical protein n=1 Tax=Streptomyces sp. NPDC058947 TaxID=3346675 RepID=UPI0036793409